MTDPVQAHRFERVQLWSDWARAEGHIRSDTGIDLVGTLNGGGLVAIQCKFFEEDAAIRKEHIDSFISASAKPEFAERPDRRDHRQAMVAPGGGHACAAKRSR